MTEFLHERIPIEGACIVCQSNDCPGATLDQYAPLLCSQRIPILLEHGIRWLIKENIATFSKFTPIIGGTIQLNSGDIGEGIQAIISGQPAAGIGGHGPGLDLGDGEVKTISEIGGEIKEYRRFNHNFGDNPREGVETLQRNNQFMYYGQIYGFCREHGAKSCPECRRDFSSLASIRVISHRISTQDCAWVTVLQRWLAFVAVPDRSNNNFQLNAETNDGRDIVTNTLGDISLPVYLEATFNIDEDLLTVHQHEQSAGLERYDATLIDTSLLRKPDLVALCNTNGLGRNGSVEELEERLNEADVDTRGVRAFYEAKIAIGDDEWSGRMTSRSTRIVNMRDIQNYLGEYE